MYLWSLRYDQEHITINICVVPVRWMSLQKGRMEDIKLPSSSPTHGPYFGICLENLLGRDYMPTNPTNARKTSLGQPLFQLRPKFGKSWYINQQFTPLFPSYFALSKNCFKHPTFSNDCIFSIKFCQYNQKILLQQNSILS